MSGFYKEWFGKFRKYTEQIGEDKTYKSLRSMLSHSRSTIALNRKVMEKDIDPSWVEAIETGLVYIDNVMRNPRKTIVNVEEVVPIALSKKITVDSIKHLAQHTDLIQSVDPVTGKITPSKVLNVHKEESLLTYENKFVNTLIDRLYIFVNKRYEKLKEASASEEVYVLEYTSSLDAGGGNKMKLSLKIETTDSLEDTGSSGSTMWERVEKIRKTVESFKASPFCQQMGANYIRPPVMRTNAIMKNVDLKACLVLWQFIEGYDKVGYEISVSDSAQKPEQDYIENLYDLSSLNLLLFRSFTQDNDRQAEILKTRTGKAAAPRILKKLDGVDTEEYDLAFAGEKRRTGEEYDYSGELPEDFEKLNEEIDKIIKIETDFYLAEEQKRLEAEEKERKRREEEQRRLEEERRIEEERRLEEERKLAEEQERLEKERLEKERIERERLEREEQERLEKERIEREKAEAEERARIEAENDELSREIEEERRKHEAERAAEEAEKERLRLEREQRETIRAEKLKDMRKVLQQKSFKEIYAEYTKNPVYSVPRGIRRIISLIRKDGKEIREGDSDNPMLIERIAAEAQAKREAELERERMKEMTVLYEKYAPTPYLKAKRFLKRLFQKKKKKIYVMPKEMPEKRSYWDQRAYDKQMREIFRKYHVSFITKIIRIIKKEN